MIAPVGSAVGVNDITDDYGGSPPSTYQYAVETPAKDTTGATLLVVAVTSIGYAWSGHPSSPISVNDNKGNTFVPIGYWLQPDTISNIELWYCFNPTVGAGHVVYCSRDTSDKFSVIFSAWSGTKQTATVVRTANGSEIQGSASGELATGNVTPVTGDLIITAIGSSTQSSDPSGPTISAGFTVEKFFVEQVYGHDSALAYLIAPNGNTFNPTWTWDMDPIFEPYDQTLASTIVVFKDAADASPDPTPAANIAVERVASAQESDIGYTFPVPFATDVTRGNTVVVCYNVTESDGYDPVLYDSQGNTYTLIEENTSVPAAGGLYYRQYVWVAENVRGGPLTVITNHANDPSTTNPTMTILEISGLPLSGTVDQHGTNYQAATDAPVSDSLTLSLPNEILVALLIHSTTPGPTITPEGTWTQEAEYETNTGATALSVLSKIVTTTGPHQASWTLGAAANSGTIIVSLGGYDQNGGGGTDWTPSAVVAIGSMPQGPFKRSRFVFQGNTAELASPIAQSVQALEFIGSRWVGNYELPPMRRADAEPWLAWLTNLKGMDGRFYAYDPSAIAPRGSVAGTPLVDGASQTGSTLATKGWTPNAANVLRAGDYLAFDTPTGWRQLHKVTADVTADGSGNADLPITPPLRESPADEEPLITSYPSCVMRLAEDQCRWSVDEANLYTIKYATEESFVSRERE